eukprot:3710388-Amphidinium_carterae.1
MFPKNWSSSNPIFVIDGAKEARAGGTCNDILSSCANAETDMTFFWKFVVCNLGHNGRNRHRALETLSRVGTTGPCHTKHRPKRHVQNSIITDQNSKTCSEVVKSSKATELHSRALRQSFYFGIRPGVRGFLFKANSVFQTVVEALHSEEDLRGGLSGSNSLKSWPREVIGTGVVKKCNIRSWSKT